MEEADSPRASCWPVEAVFPVMPPVLLPMLLFMVMGGEFGKLWGINMVWCRRLKRCLGSYLFLCISATAGPGPDRHDVTNRQA